MKSLFLKPKSCPTVILTWVDEYFIPLTDHLSFIPLLSMKGLTVHGESGVLSVIAPGLHHMSSWQHFVPRNLCFLEVPGPLGASGALGCFSDGLPTPIVLTYLPNLCLINSSPGYRAFLLLGVNWWEKDVIFCVKNTVIVIEICGKSKSCVFVVNPLILPFSFLRLEMNT